MTHFTADKTATLCSKKKKNHQWTGELLCAAIDQMKPPEAWLPGVPSPLPLTLTWLLCPWKEHTGAGGCIAGGTAALPAAMGRAWEASLRGRSSAPRSPPHTLKVCHKMWGSPSPKSCPFPTHRWTLSCQFPQGTDFTWSRTEMVAGLCRNLWQLYPNAAGTLACACCLALALAAARGTKDTVFPLIRSQEDSSLIWPLSNHWTYIPTYSLLNSLASFKNLKAPALQAVSLEPMPCLRQQPAQVQDWGNLTQAALLSSQSLLSASKNAHINHLIPSTEMITELRRGTSWVWSQSYSRNAGAFAVCRDEEIWQCHNCSLVWKEIGGWGSKFFSSFTEKGYHIEL